MTVEFDMTDIGKISHFLGIEVIQMLNGILSVNINMFRRSWRDLTWISTIQLIIMLFLASNL